MNDREMWEQLARRTVTRRGFLAGAGAVSLSAILAACNKSVAPSGATNPSAGAGKLSGPIEKNLSIYNWSGYLNPKTKTQFEQQFNVSATEDFYASNEDALAKLLAGAKGYDMVVPTGYMVEIMAKKGLLRELDFSLIPNFSLVNDRFKDTPFDPGNKFSVPKDFGTTGFGYRSDLVKEEMTSWEDFFRLAPKYSGKYTLLDVDVDVIGSTLKMLGFDWNTTDTTQINQATDELIKIKPHILTITSSKYKSLITSGEAYVAMGWNGDFLSVQADVPATKYVVATEGGEIWLDNWTVLASGADPVAAHTFINFVMQPKLQAQETSFTYYGSPVDQAEQYLSKDFTENPAVYPAPDVLAKLEFTSSDPTYTRLIADAWTKFKAA